jgi:hypothetical protein
MNMKLQNTKKSQKKILIIGITLFLLLFPIGTIYLVIFGYIKNLYDLFIIFLVPMFAYIACGIAINLVQFTLHSFYILTPFDSLIVVSTWIILVFLLSECLLFKILKKNL